MPVAYDTASRGCETLSDAMQGMFLLQRQQRPWKRILLPRKAVSLGLAPHKTQEPCSMKTKRTS